MTSVHNRNRKRIISLQKIDPDAVLRKGKNGNELIFVHDTFAVRNWAKKSHLLVVEHTHLLDVDGNEYIALYDKEDKKSNSIEFVDDMFTALGFDRGCNVSSSSSINKSTVQWIMNGASGKCEQPIGEQDEEYDSHDDSCWDGEGDDDAFDYSDFDDDNGEPIFRSEDDIEELEEEADAEPIYGYKPLYEGFIASRLAKYVQDYCYYEAHRNGKHMHDICDSVRGTITPKMKVSKLMEILEQLGREDATLEDIAGFILSTINMF